MTHASAKLCRHAASMIVSRDNPVHVRLRGQAVVLVEVPVVHIRDKVHAPAALARSVATAATATRQIKRLSLYQCSEGNLRACYKCKSDFSFLSTSFKIEDSRVPNSPRTIFF
jgi:hypothetical protein